MAERVGAAATNTVGRSALDALRQERLDLPARVQQRLRAHGAAAGSGAELVARMQTDLRARMRDVHDWDRAQGIPSRGRTPDELTLANASSWAVWEPERTLLPLDPKAYADRRPVASETHSDVQPADDRWAHLLPRVHADVVFISLNWGGTRADRAPDAAAYRFGSDFLNFHEHVPKPGTSSTLQRGLQRFLEPYVDEDGPEEFCAEHLLGGYMTDLYKGIPTTSQDSLGDLLTRDVRRVITEVMLELLELELRILAGPVRPVLACLGRAVERPVRKHFAPRGYRVHYVPHYSGAANHVPLAARREAVRRLDADVAAAGRGERSAS